MVLFIVTSKSIYSVLNGCYVNSPMPIFISIFLLHMRGVVHSSALALCTPVADYSSSYFSAVCPNLYKHFPYPTFLFQIRGSTPKIIGISIAIGHYTL